MNINSINTGFGARDSGLRGIQQASVANPFPLTPSPESRAPSFRTPSSRNTPELKEAFSDFVGQTFFGELMKQMRSTLDKPAFFHGGMGEEVFQSQLDQIVVERIAKSSANSVSDPMYRLLMAPRS
jgi:flagellar protein FlgJ